MQDTSSISVDPQFSTLAADTELYNTFVRTYTQSEEDLQSLFVEYLQQFFLFATEAELYDRADSVIKGKESIREGDFALLTNMGFRLELGQKVMYKDKQYTVTAVNTNGRYKIMRRTGRQSVQTINNVHKKDILF